MNKKDRRQFKSAVEMHCITVKQASQELIEITDSLKAAEEEKFENIPESLQEGYLDDTIEEAIEQLEETSERRKDIEEVYDETADTAEADLIVNRR